MRSGDVVKHIPTGEEWLLAYGDTDSRTHYVSACGWPLTLNPATECEVVTAATDEEWLAQRQRAPLCRYW